MEVGVPVPLCGAGVDWVVAVYSHFSVAVDDTWNNQPHGGGMIAFNQLPLTLCWLLYCIRANTNMLFKIRCSPPGFLVLEQKVPPHLAGGLGSQTWSSVQIFSILAQKTCRWFCQQPFYNCINCEIDLNAGLIWPKPEKLFLPKHSMDKMAVSLHVFVPGRVDSLFLVVCSSNLEGCNFICHLFFPI